MPTTPAVHPWRNWYHCMGNTHGTWLPGDERGFRTRHHRDHVDGDYKFPPPPGYYDELLRRSRHLLKDEPVLFPISLRPVACRLFADALAHYRVEVVVLSISFMHFHLLARFVPAGVDPYAHLTALGIKLTHARKTTVRCARPEGVGFQPMRLHAYDHDPAPRRILGLARGFVTHELKRQGHFADHSGGLWAKRPLCLPVADRAHQLAIADYIRRHADQGAAVLCLPGSKSAPSRGLHL